MKGIAFSGACLLLLSCTGPDTTMITVTGDKGSANAQVYLDGEPVGVMPVGQRSAIGDTVDVGTRVRFPAGRGNHELQIVSVRGDTLSCILRVPHQGNAFVSFRSGEITPSTD